MPRHLTTMFSGIGIPRPWLIGNHQVPGAVRVAAVVGDSSPFPSDGSSWRDSLRPARWSGFSASEGIVMNWFLKHPVLDLEMTRSWLFAVSHYLIVILAIASLSHFLFCLSASHF